jgi:hypothetical protein
MPQDALHFRQLRPTREYPLSQAMTQHVCCRSFQLACQTQKFVAAGDVPLQLRLGMELLHRQLSQPLGRSLRDLLGNAWDSGLPFAGDFDPGQ